MEESPAAGSKRPRDDEEVGGLPESESKRIRIDFFDILEDEPGPDNTDLDSLMRSLEEEISLPSAVTDPEPKQPDLGFLLEASDDELGLPPAEAAEGGVTSGDVEGLGFGKIWGIDDEIHLDFGFGSGSEDNGGDDGGVIFDGGLFDYDGGARGPSDFSDLTWRPEFSPAV